MSEGICFVTGGSGQLGSHLIEQLIDQGERVRALLRPLSATRFLFPEQVEIVRGDLLEPDSLLPIMRGVKTVYHCAAQLGDWGRWSDFVSGSVTTTRNLVEASHQVGVSRFVHVSSMAVYGRPPLPGTSQQWDEQTPAGQNFRWFDYYGRAKLAAEKVAVELGRRTTIVRPTWIYGPRDRTILPRMIQALRDNRVAIVGSGNNLLNLIHARDIAAGIVLSAKCDGSGGETFNLASTGEITQQQFFDRIADNFHVPRVNRRIPLRVADSFALLLEIVGRAIGRSKPPSVTRSGIALLSRPVLHSSEKARRVLGWQTQVPIEDGLQETFESMAHGDS
ncbi:MAG: NAD-dependent epimerase/dehydratase family protein [Pirellulaceae bacterium]|nr:NAD-dependent epimerase/dehydratase family protein [Pirellulaceae bacterium]